MIKQTLFSELILSKSMGQRIAYVAVMTAFSVVANMFLEFKMLDVQFSVTIVVSALAGIVLGPLFGFAACFLGDFIGYIFNSWGLLYLPWVGLATGMLAVFAGLIVNNVKWKFRGAVYVKLAVVCMLSFFVCTIGINTTGMYYYNKWAGFSDKVIAYVSETFGTGVSYFAYLAYRLFFLGQIWNNVANYALLFVLIPIINRTKPLKMSIT